MNFIELNILFNDILLLIKIKDTFLKQNQFTEIAHFQ